MLIEQVTVSVCMIIAPFSLSNKYSIGLFILDRLQFGEALVDFFHHRVFQVRSDVTSVT